MRPFEKVKVPERALEDSRAGLDILATLREAYPELGIRIDFHERFRPDDFFQLLPDIEALEPEAIGGHTPLRKVLAS